MKTKLLQLGFIFSLFFVGAGIAWSASPTCQTFYGGSTLGLSNVSSNLIQLNVFSNFGAGTKASVGSGASTVTGGTFKNLRLSSEGIAPGVSASLSAMLIVGQNASTSLTCTISGASATSCADTTDTVATSSPGSYVFFLITPSGTPTGADVTASVDFCPNTYDLFSLPYGGSYSAITFSYGSLMAKGNPAATLGVAQQSVVPESGNMTQLWGKFQTAGTGANPIVFTIMDNGATTTLATTSASTLPNPIADATTTISVNAGDLLNMSIWNPSASGGQAGTEYSVGWIPSIPGNFFESAGGVSPTALRETYQTPIGSGGNTAIEASTSMPTSNMLIRTTTVVLSGAPGTGHSWTYGWRDNGATTTSSCTIANTATSCTMPPVTISDNGPIDIFVLPSTSAPSGGDPSIGWIGNEQPGLFQPSQVNLTGGSLALSHGWTSVLPPGPMLHTIIFNNTSTFTVPAGVTNILSLQLWGGGGGGSSDGSIQFSGGGGAGSYVSESNVSVTPGSSITVTIGNGGNGGTTAAGGAGGTGFANGGAGGFVSDGGGGGGGSTAWGSGGTYIAAGGGGGGNGGGKGAATTAGGAGEGGAVNIGGGGGGAASTNGGAASGTTAGSGGTGATNTSGTNGGGSINEGAGTLGGGGSSAGLSGAGNVGAANSGGSGSGGANPGMNGSTGDSGGGGTGNTTGTAQTGGAPGAGGGGNYGTSPLTGGNGGNGQIIVQYIK